MPGDDGAGAAAERGLLTASEADWSLARERAAVIGKLTASEVLGHEAADEAAARLGVSRRQVYTLVARWRAGAGAVSDLLPRRSSGGRGCGRVADDVETVLQDVLRARYLTRQRRSVASVHRAIVRACRLRGLRAPSRGTVERRIAALDPRATTVAREGADAARALGSAGGEVPAPTRLLEQVQVDHTVIDLVVVDERERAPIGRPYLTVGIDVASRTVTGMVVTLEAPSATSVGLCLAHMAADKRTWLAQLEADVEWPMAGKPAQLYVDNGAEFHSEALRRGCDEHGIELRYRPPGQPHFGGVVERLVGTLMREVHELPGTTFSNPAERGGYDSETTACLTLDELQRWLAFAVAVYHGQVHEALSRPPGAVWVQQAAQNPPATVANPHAFLVDFLPVLRRRLTRTGVTIDHVQYFSDALKPLIARRRQLDRLLVRRDPRDLSRVWVLDPDSNAYLTVGYRNLARPAISLWEHRAATGRLRELGRGEVDEKALFDTVEAMRQITDTAARSTRRTRRDRARRPGRSTVAAEAASDASPPPDPPDSATDPTGAEPSPPAVPFADIEQW
ncbi:putative transposase [Pseudonocardia ammonioxydans]|uniref:Putative transposase n=1 Tax=Pseudonocardia ammonioxydans TaxID=260086 RepID=A0A1I5HRE2_PSUAM|nr:Mu transposase C-terminal domain-containing protein [Pseudonocardia ammonioxydans]SFO50894.1 putative transposase [Pseudonocardia ammonioxydans]